MYNIGVGVCLRRESEDSIGLLGWNPTPPLGIFIGFTVLAVGLASC